MDRNVSAVPPPATSTGLLDRLSLGAGASVWVGPAHVGLLLRPLGVGGFMWVFAGLYFLSGLMALSLTFPSEPTLTDSEAVWPG